MKFTNLKNKIRNKIKKEYKKSVLMNWKKNLELKCKRLKKKQSLKKIIKNQKIRVRNRKIRNQVTKNKRMINHNKTGWIKNQKKLKKLMIMVNLNFKRIATRWSNKRIITIIKNKAIKINWKLNKESLNPKNNESKYLRYIQCM